MNRNGANHVDLSQIPSVCMGLHIRRASRIISRLYDAALGSTGLGLTQFTLLTAIHLGEAIPITFLTKKLEIDQTTLTRNLKVLQKRNLVSIRPGDDRRVRIVSLTEEGEALLTQAYPLWQQVQSSIMKQLGQQEWRALLSLLASLTELD